MLGMVLITQSASCEAIKCAILITGTLRCECSKIFYENVIPTTAVMILQCRFFFEIFILLLAIYTFRVDRNKYQIQIPLPPKIDPSVTMMTVEEKPDVTYNDIGGCKEQIEKMREVSETNLSGVHV